MCGLLMTSGGSVGAETFALALDRIRARGPDQRQILDLGNGVFLGFQRLAIMDTSSAGAQPFADAAQRHFLMCNGEIYNHASLRLLTPGHDYASGSDCEVLLPLYARFGLREMLARLDGEFAFVLYDRELGRTYAARDHLGIRPLFYGFERDSGLLAFGSEAKALQPLCSEIYPFPPGHFFDGEQFVRYADPGIGAVPVLNGEAAALCAIRHSLTAAVHKRMDADVPMGYLLSGGLDSSLICALAARASREPLTTFATGLVDNPIDIKYARKVADFIDSDHHEVLFTLDEVFTALSEVIRVLESWDVTTIRASLGMYMVCRYVREHSAVRVLMSGEVSDELFGYKYTDFAPSPQAFQAEAQKRLRELFYYDGLRADRCIAAHSLEARVPFSDAEFVAQVMAIAPTLKMNRLNNGRCMGKYLLRAAFAEEKLLPESILWREKAAFSDAVGHGMVDALKAHAESHYSDAEFARKRQSYSHGTPISKEALWYREIFEQHYPDCGHFIPAFWLPNQDWQHCATTDPSARALPNYGLSGA